MSRWATEMAGRWRSLRARSRPRGAAHAVVVDAGGAWHLDPRSGAAVRTGGVEALFAACAGAGVRLLIGAPLLATMSAELPHAPLDDRDVHAWVRQQFTHFHGAAAAGWSLAVWCQRQRVLACALHGASLDAWRRQAAEAGAVLLSAEPAWAAGLRAAHRDASAWAAAPRRALAWVEADRLTWLAFDRHALVTACERRLGAPTMAGLQQRIDELSDEHRIEPARVLAAGFGLTVSQATPPRTAHWRVAALDARGPARQWVMA